jgi:hypothetical protein
MPDDLSGLTVWEPCANRGYMVDVLKEYAGQVIASDAHDYGAGFPLIDFLDGPIPTDYGAEVHAVITNPPFNKFTEFVERWFNDMKDIQHLYLLARSSITEGRDRYERIYSGAMNPVHIFQYVERVPMVQGRLDANVSTAMPYCWLHWDREKPKHQRTRFAWIPPSKKDFNREEDWPDEQTGTE